jgi:FlgD Ig-like domain
LRRLPETLIVLALLGATATAFAVTERLKLERSPITGTKVDKVFSPVCECIRDAAVISLVLRRPETVTLDILDSHGTSIRNIVRRRPEAKGRVSYTWDGLDNGDRIVPDGTYRPRIFLKRHGRTIVLPNRIRVDTTAPTIRVVSVVPRVFSPDGDGRRDRVTARFEIDEPARAMMLVNDRRRVFDRYRKTQGRLVWFGQIGGRPARPGMYEIRLRAVDQAGNRSARTRAVLVRVRYIEFAQDTVNAVAGKRFGIGVSTDARSYRWLFDGRRAIATGKRLVLRAPETPGTYVMYVVSGRFADRAQVVVEPPS